jgi:hypothetical protein
MSKQKIQIPEFKPEDIPLSCTWIIVGAPGSGKCMGKDTPIMLFDRTIILVQDIKEGDQLRGDDDLPRTVLSVCRGVDDLYEIKQSNGMTYVVNSPHILSLIDLENKKIDICLQEYLRKKEDIYKNYRGYSIDIQNKVHKVSELKISYKGKGEYFGFEIDGNRRFLLEDGTVTHNTSLIEGLCYHLKHRYPVARVFMGTEAGYRKFCEIFHPLYVSNYYDEEEEKRHILRQRTCEIENGKGYPGNYAINIIDDASDDPKIYKGKVMKGLFKLGSQHWNQLFMVGSQYAIDMPPDVRKAVSYAAIFFEPEEEERKKLYRNFGGLAGSYENFCDLMDQLTGDYTCLIFKKRTQSHNIEDNISWFRTSVLKPWKFGCKEYREWANERYDKNYKEQILI